VLSFAGDSDAHIVRGLIAILFAIYSGKRAREILATDAITLFERMGLREHLTPQRSNGFRSMVERGPRWRSWPDRLRHALCNTTGLPFQPASCRRW